MNIIDAIRDPALFLPWFADAKAPTEGGTPLRRLRLHMIIGSLFYRPYSVSN